MDRLVEDDDNTDEIDAEASAQGSEEKSKGGQDTKVAPKGKAKNGKEEGGRRSVLSSYDDDDAADAAKSIHCNWDSVFPRKNGGKMVEKVLSILLEKHLETCDEFPLHHSILCFLRKTCGKPE